VLSAGTRTLQTRLPDPAGSELPVVVLRLRGRTTRARPRSSSSPTYAGRLRSAGGHLFLSGVEPELLEQLQKSHRVDLRGRRLPGGRRASHSVAGLVGTAPETSRTS
jgi:sulfate permease, SulP family